MYAIFYDFHRHVFLTIVDIVCLIVLRWKFLPSTITITDIRIRIMPTMSLRVNDSPNTMTPMATAVNGSKAPMMAVGVAPTSCTAMVIKTNDNTVGTSPSQAAKNHAFGDGGIWRYRSGEVSE